MHRRLIWPSILLFIFVGTALPQEDLTVRQTPKTRAELKTIPRSYGSVYLEEAGHEGVFKWDGSVPIAAHESDKGEDVYVAPDAAAVGAWVRVGTKISFTPDAKVMPALQVIKHISPLNYDHPAQNAPVAVFQWSDATPLTSPNRDSFVFNSLVTGDGTVSIAPGRVSGGTSSSVWRGAASIMQKTGDGSAHTWSAQLSLGPAGSVGYNEGGLYQGSMRNTGSLLGALHGGELLILDNLGDKPIESGAAQAGSSTTITLSRGASTEDGAYTNMSVHVTGGAGAGQWRHIVGYKGATRSARVSGAFTTAPDSTSTYDVLDARDTQMVGYVSRINRAFDGVREAINFKATSEGPVPLTAVLGTTNGGAWTRGIDFADASFTSKAAIRLAEDQRINWTAGSKVSGIYTDRSGMIHFSPAGGQTRVPDGSAELPALAAEGDTSTGIYWPSSGTLAFAAGGRTRLTIAPDGVSFAVPIKLGGVQVINTRVTGWGRPTGAATRSSFSTESVTLPELAERMKALIDDLTTHGLIGP